MAYFWYKVCNQTEFEALGLVSKKYTLDLEAIGEVEILVTKGETIALYYDDVFLPVNLNDNNPFEFEDYAVYLNSDNDIFLGVLIDES